MGIENKDWMKWMQELRRSSASAKIESKKKYKRKSKHSKRDREAD